MADINRSIETVISQQFGYGYGNYGDGNYGGESSSFIDSQTYEGDKSKFVSSALGVITSWFHDSENNQVLSELIFSDSFKKDITRLIDTSSLGFAESLNDFHDKIVAQSDMSFYDSFIVEKFKTLYVNSDLKFEKTYGELLYGDETYGNVNEILHFALDKKLSSDLFMSSDKTEYEDASFLSELSLSDSMVSLREIFRDGLSSMGTSDLGSERSFNKKLSTLMNLLSTISQDETASFLSSLGFYDNISTHLNKGVSSSVDTLTDSYSILYTWARYPLTILDVIDSYTKDLGVNISTYLDLVSTKMKDDESASYISTLALSDSIIKSTTKYVDSAFSLFTSNFIAERILLRYASSVLSTNDLGFIRSSNKKISTIMTMFDTTSESEIFPALSVLTLSDSISKLVNKKLSSSMSELEGSILIDIAFARYMTSILTTNDLGFTRDSNIHLSTVMTTSDAIKDDIELSTFLSALSLSDSFNIIKIHVRFPSSVLSTLETTHTWAYNKMLATSVSLEDVWARQVNWDKYYSSDLGLVSNKAYHINKPFSDSMDTFSDSLSKGVDKKVLSSTTLTMLPDYLVSYDEAFISTLDLIDTLSILWYKLSKPKLKAREIFDKAENTTSNILI